MYKTAREAVDYIESLVSEVEDSAVGIYLSVPFTSIHSASQSAKGTKILIGAQNMNDAREGAFTGEIAGLMLKEAGASFVLLGHSERRQFFAESNDLIHKKVFRALKDDIQPVLCVGESASERKKGKMEEVLEEQITSALVGIPPEEIKGLILAYEPVWAIGTGRTPTPKEIQEAHAFCRKVLSSLFKAKGKGVPILYGGSVKPSNVAPIVLEKDVDGVLVGGASLDPKTFVEIIQSMEGAKSNPRPKKEKKK